MKKIAPLIVLCIAVIWTGIAYSAETKLSEDAIITSILEGRDIFQKTCSVCHGDDGSAGTWVAESLNPRPRDFTKPKVKEFLTRERMFHSIHNGRPNTAMQPFRHQLSEKQIHSVIDYIRAKLMKIDVFKELLKDSPSAAKAAGKFMVSTKGGEELYRTTCSVCHGDKGNADTWVSHSLNPKPKNFTDPEVIKVLDRKRMIMSVTNGLPGTAMQPFGHQLSDIQIASIVDFVRANLMKVDGGGGKKKGK